SWLGTFTPLGGSLLFTQQDPVTLGTHLWRTDGTDATTTELGTWPAMPSGSTAPLTVVGSAAFFDTASTRTLGPEELWRTDGTPIGTQEAVIVDPPGSSAFIPSVPILAGNAFLSRWDGTTGNELWKVPLAGGPAALVADINPIGGSLPNRL